MKFNFWQWMVYKDDVVLNVVNFFCAARKFWGLKYRKWGEIGNSIIEADYDFNQEAVVVLNGPSIKEQPLERLKGKPVIFANQGFRLPQYSEIHPKYHVFVDTKMVKGVWDIKWLDEIHDMVPDITFVMPAYWAEIPLLRPYIEKGYRIIWLNGRGGGIRGFGVAQVCFDLAIRIGCRKIYVTGFEDTGFARSLVTDSSHFYGRDSDELDKPPELLMQGYYMNARHVRELIAFAKHAKKSGIEVINVTKGGIVTEFKRMPFEDAFPE